MDSLTPLPHFQLKYCERCGGLWLRPDGAAVPYCPVCASFMDELPLRTPRNQRKPLHRTLDATAVALFALLANCRPELIGRWCA